MNLEITLTKEKLREKLNNFINNFDSEEFILNLARYREKAYFESAVYKHFEIEINNYKFKITQTGLGEKIRNYIDTTDKQKLQKLTTIFEKQKKEYEDFFEDSYFKDMDKLKIKYMEKEQIDLKIVDVGKSEKFKEKAVLYSILDMKEMKSIKKEAIIYGQYTNFIDLFFEHVFPQTLFFSQKNYNIVMNYNKKKKEENFIYSFKTFFCNDVDVNPYYNFKLEKGEVVGEFTDKAIGTIKKIFFDNYAKKNGITKITDADIEDVTKKFQDYYRRDNNAPKKIINKYFVSEIISKALKFSSNNSFEKIMTHMNLNYNNYLQAYINKFPKNFTENVVKYIQKSKENNLNELSDKIKNENEFQLNINSIDSSILQGVDLKSKIK